MSMYYKLNIGGVDYNMGDIKSAKIISPLFEKMSVGNTCAAELSATVWPIGNVPEMAKIIAYARERDTDTWSQLGVFYLDERSETADGALAIRAYNSMLFAEEEWTPRSEIVFPMPMPAAVGEIASLLGVAVDSRTVLNAAYTIDYPANGYTLREILGYIAGAHGGNWIITAQDALLLVPLFGSYPAETHYLVTENGDAIVVGGVRLLI